VDATKQAERPEVMEGEVVDAPRKPVATRSQRQSREVAAVPQPTPMMMLQQTVERGGSLETIAKLMDLQERWEKNEARKAYDDAMAAAKSKIPVIRKNRHVGFKSKDPNKADTSYDHEDMGEIARTVDPILSEHGLSYRFKTDAKPGQPITVTCIIAHRLGHTEDVTMTAPHDASGNKNPIQAIGSAVTYLQRYTLKAALGLAAAEDDDGKASGTAEQDRLSMEQYDEIMELVKATDTPPNMAAFLALFKAESVSDIRAKDFDQAKTTLENRNAKVKAKAEAAKKVEDQGRLV
jgi:hypothetical protein